MNLALIRYREAPRRVLGYCASAIVKIGPPHPKFAMVTKLGAARFLARPPPPALSSPYLSEEGSTPRASSTVPEWRRERHGPSRTGRIGMASVKGGEKSGRVVSTLSDSVRLSVKGKCPLCRLPC